jgi:hypothetical protein
MEEINLLDDEEKSEIPEASSEIESMDDFEIDSDEESKQDSFSDLSMEEESPLTDG